MRFMYHLFLNVCMSLSIKRIRFNQIHEFSFNKKHLKFHSSWNLLKICLFHEYNLNFCWRNFFTSIFAVILCFFNDRILKNKLRKMCNERDFCIILCLMWQCQQTWWWNIFVDFWFSILFYFQRKLQVSNFIWKIYNNKNQQLSSANIITV